MNNDQTWAFVDDQRQDAESYADLFANSGLPIVYVQSSDAREYFSDGSKSTLGVLMDVDFSGQAGALTTGLGLAQDLRAAQKRGEVREFPIVRFANLNPIEKNVGGDPSSNDLFDDFIPKSDTAKDIEGVIRKILLAQETYAFLEQYKVGSTTVQAEAECLQKFFGLPEEELDDWVHKGLATRVSSALRLPHHVAAGVFLRTVIGSVGLMVDWSTLCMRLGIDASSGEKEAAKLKSWLRPVQFSGAGVQFADRWWMAGVEQSWRKLTASADPLSIVPLDQRIRALNDALQADFEGLRMPSGSPGDRPWRWCQFCLERPDRDLVPVDTRFAIKLMPADDLAPWVDPIVASVGEAIRHIRDTRIGRNEREKLKDYR